MKLNIRKCHHKTKSYHNYNIHENNLTCVELIKDISILIDAKLSFLMHMDVLINHSISFVVSNYFTILLCKSH